MARPIIRARFAKAVSGKPMKFNGRLIPEYFTCTFYFVDNDGIKVTSENAKKFKTWSLEVLVKTTSSETVEIVKMSAEGARPFTNHSYDLIAGKTKEHPVESYSTLQARHFNQIQSNRAYFLSYAVTAILQTSKYKKTKDGGHSWTIGDYIDIPENELTASAEIAFNSAYTKLDGNFFQEFADRYRAQVLAGDRTPIKTLQELYYKEKSIKHVQSYATEARKRGLLPKAEKGKNSPVRKTRKAGKK